MQSHASEQQDDEMITREMFRANQNLVADGYLVKQLFGAGLLWLEENKERVNQLNVFPVPDGDTGTNMALTLNHAYREIAQMEETHVGHLVRALSNGALRGARGNSGVILSQLFAGIAAEVEQHEHVTAPIFAAATRSAVEYAYRAVEKPVEGTILTVSRSMMEAVQTNYDRNPDLITLLKRMLYAGRKSLRHTPELLPVLKKAGVVDSGGAGLLYIVEGMVRALCGKPLEGTMLAAEVPLAAPKPETWEDALVPEDELGYGYDVQFLMRGSGLDINRVRADIQAMGWSTLVVGDNALIKVHVHVHNPGDPLGYAIGTGASLDDIVVENMQRQYEDYLQARSERDVAAQEVRGPAVIVVSTGTGLRRVFTDQLGAAHVISGGQTMNPSIGDFLNAIGALPHSDVILLPNNKNVLLAARLAAESATNRTVRVVPTYSVPQGIAAMFEYQFLQESGLEFNLDALVDAMTQAAADIRTLEITNATRDVELDGVNARTGQFIGLLDDKLVAAADSALTVARTMLELADADGAERVTVYYGSDATHHQARDLVASLAGDFSRLEFEIVEGGQALYPYIMSVE